MKSCKSHEKIKQRTSVFSFLPINLAFWCFYFVFHMACKISNFNLWKLKHLAQASCTELTLKVKIKAYCPNIYTVPWRKLCHLYLYLVFSRSCQLSLWHLHQDPHQDLEKVKIISFFKNKHITSVSKKLRQSAVVYSYCALSQFFWNRRYVVSNLRKLEK